MKVKVWTAVGLLIALVMIMVFWHARMAADFWPIDASRVGPNLVASVIQWALILIAASLLYPPIRRAIDKWVKNHLKSANQELHNKIDHIIKHHPNIPEYKSKGESK